MQSEPIDRCCSLRLFVSHGMNVYAKEERNIEYIAHNENTYAPVEAISSSRCRRRLLLFFVILPRFLLRILRLVLARAFMLWDTRRIEYSVQSTCTHTKGPYAILSQWIHCNSALRLDFAQPCEKRRIRYRINGSIRSVRCFTHCEHFKQ